MKIKNEILTAREFREKYRGAALALPPAFSHLAIRQSKNKFHAKKKVVDGIKFDSQREAQFYLMLKMHKINFKLKETFILQDKFIHCGEIVHAVKIIPDFIIYGHDVIVGTKIIAIADVKGYETPSSKIKFKLLKHLFYGKSVPIFLPKNKTEMISCINELKKILK